MKNIKRKGKLRMISINDNMLLVIESNGNEIEYKKKIGVRHIDYIKDYATSSQIYSLSIEEIIKKTKSVMIENLDGKTLLAFLPDLITDEQMYKLELLSTVAMDNVSYMEARVYNDNMDESVLDGNVQKCSQEMLLVLAIIMLKENKARI